SCESAAGASLRDRQVTGAHQLPAALLEDPGAALLEADLGGPDQTQADKLLADVVHDVAVSAEGRLPARELAQQLEESRQPSSLGNGLGLLDWPAAGTG